MLDIFTHSGIISPSELINICEAQHRPSPKLIDASFVLPNSPDDPHHGFKEQHIEGAQFFDINKICARDSDLPHMLPSAEDFAAYIGAMGISSDDFVVIYGQSGMVMGAARAWWMFRAFGHDNVAVLNGGLPAWIAGGHPVITDSSDSDITRPTPADFTATLDPSLVVNKEQMLGATTDSDIQIYDARPSARFNGETPEPRAAMRSGHMPTAHNIPASSLVNQHDGCLKSREELEQIFMIDGRDFDKKTYTTCGSGVTACVLALALYSIGATDVAVYDGSWSEWGLESSGMPIR